MPQQAPGKIQPDRYVDFYGLPVENAPIKRLIRDWGVAAALVTAGAAYTALPEASPAKLALSVAFSYVGQRIVKRFVLRNIDHSIFPDCVIDTKPEIQQRMSPENAGKSQPFHTFNKMITLPSGGVHAVLMYVDPMDFTGVGAFATCVQRAHVTHNVRNGKWTIVPRDQMKQIEPA